MRLVIVVMLLLLLSPVACRPDNDPGQQLIEAAKQGDATQVTRLLKRGADVNSRERNGQLALMGYSALMWAASKGHLEVAEHLLANGAAVNAGDSKNRSALMMAAAGGHLDLVALLVEAGADIHARSKYDDTALLTAAGGGHNEVVEWLLTMGAEVNAANDLAETALMAAALRGHTQTVARLLAAGASIEAEDDMGNSALLLAATGVLYKGGGSAETVRLLLTHGADVNKGNNDGITPLMGAASRGNLAVAEALLAAGADPAAQIFFGHDQGETALSLAMRNNYPEIVRLLQTGAPEDR